MNKDFEIRSSDIQAQDKKLVGYVVQWNSPSELIWGDFVEQFAPNAFAASLASGQDVRALFEHDHTKLLGRTSAGTLKLEEDAVGLRFELTPPDTTLGRDLLVSVERGDISGMSFGFYAKAETWDFEVTPCLRTVNSAELVEITVTSIPAYPESNVQIASRSMAQAKAKMQQKSTALLSYWADLAGL
ncbi:HK97 family phage prohead protease [Avibacterium gallinarum]|uniref:HK97 family phage prohead protease n=1 Tax=Avibacterium gallinarum TaxID=755 RepID=UPI003BF8546D